MSALVAVVLQAGGAVGVVEAVAGLVVLLLSLLIPLLLAAVVAVLALSVLVFVVVTLVLATFVAVGTTIWIYHDATERGRDDALVWSLAVTAGHLLTGVGGLLVFVVYLLVRDDASTGEATEPVVGDAAGEPAPEQEANKEAPGDRTGDHTLTDFAGRGEEDRNEDAVETMDLDDVFGVEEEFDAPETAEGDRTDDGVSTGADERTGGIDAGTDADPDRGGSGAGTSSGSPAGSEDSDEEDA